MECPICHSENKDDSRYCSRCAAPLGRLEPEPFPLTKSLLTPLPDISQGGLIAGKYRIIEEVGHGGMGVVYKAEDLKLKRPVALKFLPPQMADSADLRERFLIEAQAAASLSHPNICVIHEAGESDGRLYIAMEYVDGKTLRHLIKTGPLGAEDALRIAIQVAEGLDEAHGKGIIHRDIKGANIMVTGKGQAKVMDFGLAKVKERTHLTREGTTLGTVAYMSPEQARGEEADQRSDIWSLGVVLYELLSGTLPFKGEREASILYAVVHEEPKPLKTLRPDVPPELQRIVDRCLKKKPDDRFGSAAELLEVLRDCLTGVKAGGAGSSGALSLARRLRRPAVAVPAAVVVAGAALALVLFFTRQGKIRWARDKAVPEIQGLVDDQHFEKAFRLAEKARKLIPREKSLMDLLPQVERDFSFQTVPPGAEVSLFDEIDGQWKPVGRTPIETVKMGRGYHRWKIEKSGYEPLEGSSVSAGAGDTVVIRRTLDVAGSLPPGMVRVPGGIHVLGIAGLDHLAGQRLNDYFIDRCEVTNKEFKSFIDQGGYDRPEFWKYPFKKGGHVRSREEAMAEFKDKTGRPGPAAWEMSDYPEGQGDYPVRGISWYEAAAYAKYSGKSLPTIYHWDRAADTGQIDFVIPLSNFNERDVWPVGRSQAVSPYGLRDMAGNVSEWCWNERGDWRFILGGAWNDPGYFFSYAFAQPPMDRSLSHGFRCIKPIGTDDNLDVMRAGIKDPYIDYMLKERISDEVFRIYLGMYAYDMKSLNSRVEAVDDSDKDWVREKVSFDAAYGGERVPAYLFLPKSGKPPYQAVVVFPGSSAINRRSSGTNAALSVGVFDFFLKSGRAVLLPVYKSTYERGDGWPDSVPNETNAYREHVIQWAQDLCRSLDYLESRDDIDSGKIAYFGFSWGGRLGGLMVTVGARFKAAILYVAGFRFQKQKPEVDPFHFVTRVRIPVLMLNGRYDGFFPYETAQIPMFKLLGTPAEDKKYLIYDTGHSIPKTQLIKESLAWLDKYLGPVKRKQP